MSWEDTTRVRCRRPRETSAIYETAAPDDIRALVAALATTPGSGAYCMCFGTLVLELDGADVTLHHGESLRWDGSGGNQPLVDPDALMRWLSARGMDFVRAEYDESRERGNQTAIEAARWRAAMPASLLPFFDDMRSSGGSSRPEWTAAIEAEIPDRVARTRAMLELYGSGVGKWSGYPSWESVPLQLVVEQPYEIIVAAIGDAPSERCCEGALRLICSWDYRKRSKKLVAKLPAPVRERLLAHARSMPDENRVTALAKLG